MCEMTLSVSAKLCVRSGEEADPLSRPEELPRGEEESVRAEALCLKDRMQRGNGQMLRARE